MGYTKAEMLQYLKRNISSLNILPVYIVGSNNFFENRNVDSVAVDNTEGYSNAGKFKSVLNVAPDSIHIEEAVADVYASYETNTDEQILIQPMLENIKSSGVVFTSDIETFAEYYTVNYNVGCDSSAVTGGSSNNLNTYIRYKNSEFPMEDPDMNNLLETCKKIEIFLNNDALDIEFAITDDGEVYILQVRPIARKNEKPKAANIDLASTYL